MAVRTVLAVVETDGDLELVHGEYHSADVLVQSPQKTSNFINAKQYF